jgi:hypothetical protein
MNEAVAAVILGSIGIYLSVGLVVAVTLAVGGLGRIDPQAREGTLGFRLLVLPGAIALWPLLLRRWRAGTGPPEERSPHRDLGRRRPSA